MSPLTQPHLIEVNNPWEGAGQGTHGKHAKIKLEDQFHFQNRLSADKIEMNLNFHSPK